MPGQLPSLTAPGSRQPPAGEPPAGGRAAGVTAVTHRARDRAAACRSGPVLLGVTRRHSDSDSDRDCCAAAAARRGGGGSGLPQAKPRLTAAVTVAAAAYQLA